MFDNVFNSFYEAVYGEPFPDDDSERKDLANIANLRTDEWDYDFEFESDDAVALTPSIQNDEDPTYEFEDDLRFATKFAELAANFTDEIDDAGSDRTFSFEGNEGRGFSFEGNEGREFSGFTGDEGKIINGRFAQRSDWPWIVRLRGCGGAIVGRRFVATAAHCCVNNMQLGISVTTGPEYRGYLGRVVSYRNHWRYSSQFDFDFCLLYIDREIKYKSDVQPICMHHKNEELPAVGTSLYVAGWGKTERGTSSNRLKEARVPLVSYSQCNSQESYRGFAKQDSMICAGYQQGGIDACQGDSGGPIVSLHNSDSGVPTPRLIGVVSWGFGCAKRNFYGIYGKLSSAVDFYENTAKAMISRRQNELFPTLSTTTTSTSITLLPA